MKALIKFLIRPSLFLATLTLALSLFSVATAQEAPIKVGVPTLLSGDWAGLGQNIAMTVETYKRYYLKHPVEFIFEDAKVSSADGLKAYQRLISLEQVDLLVSVASANATVAGAPLANASRTVAVSVSTGGENVDRAGDWVFRLGNSDVLNGIQQAQIFIKNGIKSVALISEETEYTQDISRAFRREFEASGGQIDYSSDFSPDTTDFRTQVVALKAKAPAAIFFTTQTGTSLALFLRQLDQLGGFGGQIHTTFTAADNPDANEIAKGKFRGLHYLAPAYNKESPKLKEFLKHYHKDHGKDPLITFHSAATVDALDLLQAYLEKHKRFDREGFRQYLLSQKNYPGLMGEFSFDAQGNANTGFVAARIEG